jgi:hypothetical protein
MDIWARCAIIVTIDQATVIVRHQQQCQADVRDWFSASQK